MFEARNYQFKHPFSSVTPALLRRYANHTFIETGTNVGLGVSAAIAAGCFKEILSFENDLNLFMETSPQYQGMPSVRLLHMESDDGLRLFCPRLTVPCTFFLDAHALYSNPLLAELDAIATSPCHTHTILIDDMRMCGTVEWNGLSFEEIKDRLYLINPYYHLSFEDTKNGPRDLLVAQVEAENVA